MAALATEEYALQLELDEPLPAARERVSAALKEQGFGVLTEIDVQATLKEKLDVDSPPYRILGVCNPPLAHQALSVSPHVGLMLPCTVTLREERGATIVEILRPEAALDVLDIDEIRPIAEEAEERLERVAAALQQSGSRPTKRGARRAAGTRVAIPRRDQVRSAST